MPSPTTLENIFQRWSSPPLEIVFNKPHPSILLHISDATTQKVLILLLQEIKRDIVYRQAQLQEPCRREELHPRIQAHLVSVINKISSLLEYQGTLQLADGLSFLPEEAVSNYSTGMKFLLISPHPTHLNTNSLISLFSTLLC